jgi:bifunctional N-acetylglucosamine-1-phosphate-uridyltransferase/glucosamine-1-phosphate-acetyltransferase GlmU-like protein
MATPTGTDDAMTNEERDLVDRWIVTFCETPPVIDAELMRRLIAEQEATQQGAQPCQTRRSRPATA